MRLEAIMDLISDNPGFEEAGIEVVSVSCTEPASKGTHSESGKDAANVQETQRLEAGQCDNPNWMNFKPGCICADGPTESFP